MSEPASPRTGFCSRPYRPCLRCRSSKSSRCSPTSICIRHGHGRGTVLLRCRSWVVFFSTSEREEFLDKTTTLNLYRLFILPFRTPTFVNRPVYVPVCLSSPSTWSWAASDLCHELLPGAGRWKTENVLGVLMVCQVIALPVFVKPSERTDKRRSYIAAMSFLIVVMILGLLFTPICPTSPFTSSRHWWDSAPVVSSS